MSSWSMFNPNPLDVADTIDSFELMFYVDEQMKMPIMKATQRHLNIKPGDMVYITGKICKVEEK